MRSGSRGRRWGRTPDLAHPPVPALAAPPPVPRRPVRGPRGAPAPLPRPARSPPPPPDPPAPRWTPERAGWPCPRRPAGGRRTTPAAPLRARREPRAPRGRPGSRGRRRPRAGRPGPRARRVGRGWEGPGSRVAGGTRRPRPWTWPVTRRGWPERAPGRRPRAGPARGGPAGGSGRSFGPLALPLCGARSGVVLSLSGRARFRDSSGRAPVPPRQVDTAGGRRRLVWRRPDPS
jgi:hypothetical protein